MVPDFSNPLNGFQRAAWDIDKIAQRIASQGAHLTKEGVAASIGLDPAANTALVAQVENTAEADVRVLSSQDEASRNILNLFA